MKIKQLEKKWILYDVGNSAFILLLATIIPIYFKNISSEQGVSLVQSTAYWGYTLALSTLIIALIGPILGAIADHQGMKKKLFIIFVLIGVMGCFALAFTSNWILFAVAVIIARIGFSGSIIFYDGMLVDITSEQEMDKVSSFGYAFGYIGSCIPFIMSMIIILNNEAFNLSPALATSISFIMTSIWWFCFSIPLIRSYHQRYYIVKSNNLIKDSIKSLKTTFITIKNNKIILSFLIAFFLYIDGVFTIIEMATSYGKDVGISDTSLLLALLLTQIVAFPCAIIVGVIAKKVTNTKIILISIIAYLLITIFAMQLDKAWEFWLLAVCVAIFQGGIQALSRSYFAQIIPKEKANEYFGIFDIFGKGATFFGVLIMAFISQLTGSSRYGLFSLVIILALGLIAFSYHLKLVAQEKRL
ncbi:MAG: MFS transporter [Bacilli bacterium]